MIERRIVRVAFVGAAALLLVGHSPYAQWYAYRAKHLVVVAASSDVEGAEAVAKAIAARWPRTRAVSAAAPSTADVVKLLRSGQLQLGLLPAFDALEAAEGRGRFADGPKVALRTLAVVRGELLVVMERFPGRGAYQITQALAERTSLGTRGQSPIEFHPGALDYYEGRQAPDER